jgi:hypothetical protein
MNTEGRAHLRSDSKSLSGDGIQLNVTALLTLEQVRSVCKEH